MAETPLTAEDRLDIADLMAQYAWAVDSLDPEAFGRCFTEDGSWASAGEPAAVGRAAVVERIKGYFARPERIASHHQNAQIRIVGNGTEATAYIYYWSLRWSPTTKEKSMVSLGFYESRCVKQNGAWLMKARTNNSWIGTNAPWKKHTPPMG